jgi:hypothetical protein
MHAPPLYGPAAAARAIRWCGQMLTKGPVGTQATDTGLSWPLQGGLPLLSVATAGKLTLGTDSAQIRTHTLA